MTKNPYFAAFIAVAGALTLAFPLITSAETNIDSGSRETLKQRIQQNYQNYSVNVRNNEDYRNSVMEKRIGSSSGNIRREDMPRDWSTSTRPLPPGMMVRKFGSSTDDRFERDNRGRAEMVHMMVFAQMKAHLVEQLSHAMDNLKQIRSRISARIDTEAQKGKDMTSAKALLVTADAKIVLADQAILALRNFTPTATSTATTTIQASTTLAIELGKPREIGANAIKAVNDARKSLNEVVSAIIKIIK